MKSYLSGSPELHLALNDDLVIASAGKGGYGMVGERLDMFIVLRYEIYL